MAEQHRFVSWDYVVFTLMLAVSAAIGIFYGCRGSKQKTTKEFLLANRSLSIVPVAISILVSIGRFSEGWCARVNARYLSRKKSRKKKKKRRSCHFRADF